MDGAAIGLGFLDAALRLNHVRRLTERLSIEEHRIANRITEVDISINMLTDTQLEAARTFQTLVTHSSADAASESPESTIWVPVARLSRTHVGPIEVHDASGRRLPRLTQYESSRLIASGLYRLLRGILVSYPEALNPETELGKIMFRFHEPRWLLQSAILTVLTEGSRPQTEADEKDAEDRINAALSDPFRGPALRVLQKYKKLLADYEQLFNVAVSDYIVVVALDSRFDEHLLTFEAPLYETGSDSWRDRFARVGRLFRASREGYYVTYQTDIPTTLRSYHLQAEATPGVDMARIFLTTNAHESEVNALSRDLNFAAERFESIAADNITGQTGRVLELELQVLLRRLSELMRRCRWEASTAGVAVPQASVKTCNLLIKAEDEYETALRRGGPPMPSLLKAVGVTADNLRLAATEINHSKLRYDISVESQPTSNRAHVYWRRPPPSPISSGRTHIRAGMLLRNTAESSARMIVTYAVVVAGISYLMACFLAKTFWPYGPSSDPDFATVTSPDACVAILLLVPGFWYTRLSLPTRHSVSGHLRAVPRLVTYLCIASAVLLAVDIAAGAAGWITRLIFILAGALPIASTLLLLRFRTRPMGIAHTLARLDAPLWVTTEDAPRIRRVIPDAEFKSSRSPEHE